VVNLEEFIAVKGIKALGNQFSTEKIKQVNLLDSLPFEEPKEETTSAIEVVDEEVIGEKLTVEIAATEIKKPVVDELTADEKAKIALQRSIAKKKAEQKKLDDENQTKLF